MIIATLPSSVCMCTEHMVYSKTNANLVFSLCAQVCFSLCVRDADFQNPKYNDTFEVSE